MDGKAVVAVAAVLLACSAPKRDEGERHADRPREAMVGHRAPVAALELLGGDRVMLQDLVGRKPIYLKFWATWCVPCRKQMPHLEAAHRKYGDRIAVFAVNLGLNDPIDAVRAFQSEQALTVPIAIDADGSLAERYHVAVTPQHILVDRAGIVRYVGHTTSAELDAALEALVGDAAPQAEPLAQSKPAPQAEPLAHGTQPIGEPPPLTLRDGSTFTLAAHAGRPVALSFVSAFCDWYLAKSRPAMSEACIAHARQLASLPSTNPHVTWVLVMHPVWTTADDVDEFRKKFAITAPIGIDDQSAWFHRFGVRDVATTILLDARGAEVARITGNGDDLPRALATLR